jgi:hypothetical protein
MQDGEFTERRTPHFIGRAIFIFAGGTNHSMQQFNKHAKSLDPSDKAQDFISRLRGHIDIFGPNPRQCPYTKNALPCSHFFKKYGKTTNHEKIPASKTDFIDKQIKKYDSCKYKPMFCCDPNVMLRRATLLRSLLEKYLDAKSDETIPVDNNVLTAFMKANYLHGARSLEAIVQSSDIAKGKNFSAPCIHTNALGLHVNKTVFCRLLKSRKNEVS